MTNLTKKTNKKSTLLFAILTLTIVGFSGCAKDRPDRNEQRDFDKVELSVYDGKEFTLETVKALSQTPLVSDAVNLSADVSSASLSDQFTLMTYKTNSNIFEDVPFFGLPGQKYTLRYEVTNTHLVINKVAKPELIPFTERTFAKKEGSNLVVPTVGYPLTLFKKKRTTNLDDEFTNQFEFIVVQKVSEATHMRVDLNSRETFEIEKKLNVLPVDLFTGSNKDEAKQWFYSATVVGAPPALANSIGRDVTADFSQGSVSRIKFIKADNAIMGVNLNIDKEIDTKDENNLSVIIRVPVEWLDFRQAKEGVNNLLSEEVLDDESKESVAALKRPYIKADFTQVTTAASGGFDTSFSNDFSLFDLEISEGYISFVTENTTSKIRTRYSFRAAHKPKIDQIKRYFKNDRDIFGYFTTTLNKLRNYRQERDDEIEKNILINHYMPEVGPNGKRKITYHFSKLTKTESMRDVSRIAVDVWNKAFQEANTGIEIVLDESKDVNLGDLRYNIINVVDSKNGGSLLGYGPTIADTDTGEIIAGSSNIYADPFREMLVRDVRNYIRSRRGLFAPNYLGSSKPTSSLVGSSSLDAVLEFTTKLYEGIEEDESMLTNRSLIKSLAKTKSAHLAYKSKMAELASLKGSMKLPHFVLKVEEVHNQLKADFRLTERDFAELNSKGVSHHGAFETASKDVVKEIESRCKPELDAYIETLEEDDVLYNDDEEEVILNCINKRSSTAAKGNALDKKDISLLESRVLSTLVHEMGHNFSLRHNFVASTDSDHYSKDEHGHILSQSSSVMDYNRGNVDELLAPAKYDIEAIRFLYGNAVTLENGKNHAIVKTKSLLAQLGDLKRLPLKFCTDEDASYDPQAIWSRNRDPLCARHDHGKNPLEIVRENVLSVNSYIAVGTYRYDKAFIFSFDPLNFVEPGTRASNAILQRNFLTLQKIYSQWRFHFAAFVGDENRYLESYSEEEFQKQLERMKNDTDSEGEPSVHAKNYAEYYQASVEAYEFLKQMAFNTAKYCRFDGTAITNGSELFEFERLQNSVYRDTGKSIQACTDSVISDWAKSHYTGKPSKEVTDEMVQLVNPVVDGVTLNGYGEYANDVRATLDPNSLDFDKINIAGLDLARRYAFMILTVRAPLMKHLANMDFVPNFLDREKYMEEVRDLLKGRSIDGLTQDTVELAGIDGKFQYKKFVKENATLAEMMLMFDRGLIIPGNRDATSRRLGMTQVFVTQDSSIIPASFARFNIGGTFIAAHPDATVSGPIITKRIELAAQQRLGKSSEDVLETVPASEVFEFLVNNNPMVALPPQAVLDQGDVSLRRLFDGLKAYIGRIEVLTRVADKKFVDTMNLALVPYIAITNIQLPDQVLDGKSSDFFSDESVVNFFNQNFPSLVNAVEGRIISIFSRDNATPVANMLVEEIAKDRELQIEYRKNSKDIDAQLNLLTDILMRLGR